MHDRTPAAAAELTAVNSGHPDPNGLRQEPRVILSFTPVVAAFHLVAETTKTTIAAASPFPSSGSDHRRRRIRRLQRVPEPVSTPTATAVSYATVSPFFPALSRPLGPSPTAAESFTPPAMSPSWPRSP